MIYQITHETTYRYSEPVSLCHNIAHLTPRETRRQNCRKSSMKVDPRPAVTRPWIDFYGNPTVFFTVQEPHHELKVTAEHLTETLPFAPPDAAGTPPWETVRDHLRMARDPDGLDAYQFVFESPYIKFEQDFADYAAVSFRPGAPLLQALLDLTARLHADFRYDPLATTVTTPLREAFAARRGVCQDFAHIEIACLRSLGLAARYVSGYLLTHPPPGQTRLVGADASHAWLSVYCPGIGWIDVDPTNDAVPSDQHILLAWGRDFDDVSPIKGVILGGGKHTVSVAVDVVPTAELEAYCPS